jgi:hypothetical protein
MLINTKNILIDIDRKNNQEVVTLSFLSTQYN